MVVCAIFACGVFCVRAGVEVNLAGAWTLTGRDDKGVPIACPIDVPGDTYSALLSAAVIPDPYFGCNETNVQWVGMQDWRIARTFVVEDDVLSAREAVLRIEDCDTFCTIEVNGHRIGKTENRFRRYEFDVKPWLKGGTNTIAGVFESPCRVADERRKGYWRSCPMSNVAPWARNMAFIRKPACHGGWDWGPTLMLEGFCGTVKILASDRPRVEYVYTDQAFAEDLSKCTLTVFAEMSDATVVTNRIEIDNPPLWWPHGYGEQRFYHYSVKVGDETIEGRVGLRKLEVLNEHSVSEKGKDELSLTFRVNGRRIFAKGANWIPCDALECRQTEDRYRDLLESAVAANMNMIRLWGGGKYEKDCFYDLCDELGILVWHDMMCSCAVYPAHDEFLEEIRGELAHQLRRLRDHASIAIWCGDNECLGAINWFPELDPKIRPRCREEWVRRSKLQGELVAKYDPGRTYWPSSPCAGPGSFADNWKNDAQGDMHNWQVWADNRPFDAYYEFRPRFCSEFGYQSFPSMEVAETFASRSDILARGADFEWHQKNTGGNRKIRETMERYFPLARDVPSELILSQFQQAMGIKMGVEAWRAQRPRCMGTLFWQLNDNWPVSSWSSIEYGGKWKPLHYLAKQFYEPIRVVAQPDVSTGKADVTRGTVYALNDTDEVVDGELTVEYWTYDGQIASAQTKHVTVPPESATEVEVFREPEGRKTFLVLTLRTRCGICQNDWHFDFYRNVPLAATLVKKEVSFKDDTMQVVLEADKPAFFVWADIRGCRGVFSDNAITLLPGRPRTIVWAGKDAVAEEKLVQRLSITHLFLESRILSDSVKK